MGKLELLAKLNDICLFADDFQGSLDFYVQRFGFRVKRLQPDAAHANYAEFDFNGASVTLWQRDAAARAMEGDFLGPRGHPFMLAVRVPALGDVDGVCEELTARGVRCIHPPTTYPFGSRAAYFQDFEENIWEVFAWEEGNGPGLV